MISVEANAARKSFAWCLRLFEKNTRRLFESLWMAGDMPRLRQTNGHLITFNWNYTQMGLVAQVSLFNAITYHVLFCLHVLRSARST